MTEAKCPDTRMLNRYNAGMENGETLEICIHVDYDNTPDTQNTKRQVWFMGIDKNSDQQSETVEVDTGPNSLICRIESIVAKYCTVNVHGIALYLYPRDKKTQNEWLGKDNAELEEILLSIFTSDQFKVKSSISMGVTKSTETQIKTETDTWIKTETKEDGLTIWNYKSIKK